MGARQDADFGNDRTHGTGITAIDADTGLENRAAHDVFLDILEQLGRDFLLGGFGEDLLDLRLYRRNLLMTGAFLLLVIGCTQIGRDRRAQTLVDIDLQRVRTGERPRLFRRLFGKIDDRVDDRLEGLMAEHDGAQHHVF